MTKPLTSPLLKATLLLLVTAPLLFTSLGCDNQQDSLPEGSSVLKDYVRNPLDKAEEASEEAESRSEEYDAQLEKMSEE